MNEALSNVLVGIPADVANLQLPDPTLRDLYRDEENRVYWLDSMIDDTTLDLVKMIMRCNKEDKGVPAEERKPIRVFVDSPGGDVITTWSVINAIKMSKTPIVTINFCTAYSASCLILAAGHKRYALPGTSAMIHDGSCSYSGEAKQVDSTKKFFDKLDKKLNEDFFANTKIDKKTYKKKAATDWFLTEDEMLEYGVVDGIITDFDELF